MPPKPVTPFADMLQLTGLTHPECVEYLALRGVKTSPASVKAWCRGLYAVPEPALLEITKLFYAIIDEHATLPDGTPEGAVRRRQIVEDLASRYRLVVTVSSHGDDSADFEVSDWMKEGGR